MSTEDADKWASELVGRITLVSKNEATLVVIRALKAVASKANDRFVKTVDLLDVADTLARALVDENEARK